MGHIWQDGVLLLDEYCQDLFQDIVFVCLLGCEDGNELAGPFLDPPE